MNNEKTFETSLITPITSAFIERRIHLIRDQKVMIDADLADLYQVENRVLIQSMKRSQSRFPSDFMFQLSLSEAKSLRSQFVISKVGRGGRRYLPYAFTELGVAMLSSVLNSDRAVQMNIFIMRAFVRLRELLLTHKELAQKIEQLEKEQKEQGKDITEISRAVNLLIAEKVNIKDAIGFHV